MKEIEQKARVNQKELVGTTARKVKELEDEITKLYQVIDKNATEVIKENK